jgi:hypothetical protein
MAGPDALLIHDPRPPELGEKSVKLVSICQSKVKGVMFYKGETNDNLKKQIQMGEKFKGTTREAPYYDKWVAAWCEQRKLLRKYFNVRDYIKEGESIYNAGHHAEAFHEARRAAEGEENVLQATIICWMRCRKHLPRSQTKWRSGTEG